jgi:hypothetical protein
MKTEPIEAPKFEPLDADEYKRQATLLKTLHCARPVCIDGKEEFLRVIHARQSGGRIEMEVWITGRADPVAPESITIPKRD